MKEPTITAREIARREWALDEEERNLIAERDRLMRELAKLDEEHQAVRAKRLALQRVKARLEDGRLQ